MPLPLPWPGDGSGQLVSRQPWEEVRRKKATMAVNTSRMWPVAMAGAGTRRVSVSVRLAASVTDVLCDMQPEEPITVPFYILLQRRRAAMCWAKKRGTPGEGAPGTRGHVLRRRPGHGGNMTCGA